MVTRHFLCGRSMTICDTAACLSCFINSSRILMSSWSSEPYSALPANQRESQVRLMPTRSPTGLTFRPIAYSSGFRPRLDLTHNDRQVRERFENSSDAAAAARGEALDHQRLSDMGLGDDKIVDVEVVIVLGVCDRRFQALADILGDALVRKLQIGERTRDLLAANELGDEVELLRGNPQHPAHSLGLVLAEVSLALALAHDRTLCPLALARRRRGCRSRRPRCGGRAHPLSLAIGRMAIKHPCRRELAELVTDHLFVHHYGNVLLAVIDSEIEPDELRQDGRAPAPYLDQLVTARRARGLCLAQQITVDKRTFPN